jgi:hypothetical protein
MTPGGTKYQKVLDGDVYHQVYDWSPSKMAGTNYGVSMDRTNIMIG